MAGGFLERHPPHAAARPAERRHRRWLSAGRHARPVGHQQPAPRVGGGQRVHGEQRRPLDRVPTVRHRPSGEHDAVEPVGAGHVPR